MPKKNRIQKPTAADFVAGADVPIEAVGALEGLSGTGNLGIKALMAGQDMLALEVHREKGLIDPERVGIAGWSYGGYLSALAATHHSDRFKAAVMGAGISNWVSFMGTTDITHEMSIVHWNQWWQDDPGMYWRRSPLSKIDDAQTPTLILHGKNDVRVNPGQAMEMYLALKRKGVPTELVFYPRAAHGISERAHRIDMYQRQLDWFDRHVR